MNIWLDRLAPGARIEVLVVVQGPSAESVQVSAAYDQGTSTPIDEQTFSDQVKGYVGSTTGLFGEAYRIVADSEAVQTVSRWCVRKPAIARFLDVVRKHEFQTVGLAVLIVVGAIGLFFSYEHFMLATIAGAWLVTWVFFFDVTIPADFLIIPLSGLVGAYIVSVVVSAVDRIWMVVSVSVIFTGIIAFGAWWFWYARISASWIIGILVAAAAAGVIDWANIFKSGNGSQ